ncbi:MAG: DNA topoisomerase (ATP-hydrolyzing) subunit A [Oscillospiraceae bacterium]|nr:DNA topoisomerase (ATP-hydrolyzing) subunit A [Oscillospiraceae bacterium]
MKKSQPKQPKKPTAYIEGAGIVVEKPVTETIEENYMPYAMSVIVSRALPEIDGFKPSHRKLLYTMYKMGLLTGSRTKSANIVGQTMRLNPHGDAAIYETMVRLARANEALLHPYVDSKGNFGKSYSRDMAYAASRYTEAKLEPLCKEVFDEIDRDTVDFAPNYDSTTTEPLLLPVKFPSVLVNSNIGIAVSMASNICSFNLAEVCETTIALLKDPSHDIISTLKAPDFSGGGYIIYNEGELREIYRSGRGSFKVRAKYNFDSSNNVVEITEIPPTTTIEAIIDKIVEHVKNGKIKEISDVRDETDLSGLKITLDLKRGINKDGCESLMRKLFRLTPLQDSFSCNFNVLVAGVPRVFGVGELLTEWIAFRTECVKRRVYFELNKKKERLHLLRGLQKILLDIDKAIKLIRETREDAEVVPNLMIGFGIDENQAEYVAEIKLRHINREYILKRTEEIANLEKDIAELQEILDSKTKVKNIIIAELKEIAKKYGGERKTLFVFQSYEDADDERDEVPDYPVNIFFTNEGYFKKITPLSLRMSGEQKLKEQDFITLREETANRTELLFFTDKGQAYKSRASDFEDTKASVMGDFIPSKLDFEDGEKPVALITTQDYSETLILFFENGKCAKVPLVSFETKTKRRKLQNSFSTASTLVAIFKITADCDFILRSSADKSLIFNTALVLPKASRDTQGVQVMRLTKAYLKTAEIYTEGKVKKQSDVAEITAKTLPAAGKLVKIVGSEQLTIDNE